MAEGCTKPATTVLFQVVGSQDQILQLPLGAFCADHLMSEKKLHEKRGERMAMQVIAEATVQEQTCCWLPEVEAPPALGDLAQRRIDSDADGMFRSPERLANMVAQENVWAARMPGTGDLRTLLGMVAGMIIQRGVHPRLVTDYLREVMRDTFPSVFDGPI